MPNLQLFLLPNIYILLNHFCFVLLCFVSVVFVVVVVFQLASPQIGFRTVSELFNTLWLRKIQTTRKCLILRQQQKQKQKNSTGENKPNQEGCVGWSGELIKRGTCSSNLYALLQSLQGSVIKQIVEEVLFCK